MLWKKGIQITTLIICIVLAACVDSNSVQNQESGSTDYEYREIKTTYVYKQVGDLKIKADVLQVEDDVARPVVVWIHGGALMTGGRDSVPKWAKTRLFASGYDIISIDYRLAPETKLPEIIADLEELRDPETGELVVARVHRREELYHGPYLDCAPDLVVEWHDYGYWGRDRVKPTSRQLFQVEDTFEFSSLPLTGSHRLDGILIAYGATVRAGARIEGAHITDLASTILYCLGLSVPAFMDGRMLTELFAGQVVPTSSKTQVADVSPERPRHAYSAEEAETIHKRLEELGYL